MHRILLCVLPILIVATAKSWIWIGTKFIEFWVCLTKSFRRCHVLIQSVQRGAGLEEVLEFEVSEPLLCLYLYLYLYLARNKVDWVLGVFKQALLCAAILHSTSTLRRTVVQLTPEFEVVRVFCVRPAGPKLGEGLGVLCLLS